MTQKNFKIIILITFLAVTEAELDDDDEEGKSFSKIDAPPENIGFDLFAVGCLILSLFELEVDSISSDFLFILLALGIGTSTALLLSPFVSSSRFFNRGILNGRASSLLSFVVVSLLLIASPGRFLAVVVVDTEMVELFFDSFSL